MIRLHLQYDPNNPTHIKAVEEIAGVPQGTHTAVMQHRATAALLDGEAGFQHWRAAQGTPVGTLDAFLTNGWGRMAAATAKVAEVLGDPQVGSTDHPGAIAALLDAQGVNPQAVYLTVSRGLTISWN